MRFVRRHTSPSASSGGFFIPPRSRSSSSPSTLISRTSPLFTFLCPDEVNGETSPSLDYDLVDDHLPPSSPDSPIPMYASIPELMTTSRDFEDYEEIVRPSSPISIERIDTPFTPPLIIYHPPSPRPSRLNPLARPFIPKHPRRIVLMVNPEAPVIPREVPIGQAYSYFDFDPAEWAFNPIKSPPLGDPWSYPPTETCKDSVTIDCIDFPCNNQSNYPPYFTYSDGPLPSQTFDPAPVTVFPVSPINPTSGNPFYPDTPPKTPSRGGFRYRQAPIESPGSGFSISPGDRLPSIPESPESGPERFPISPGSYQDIFRRMTLVIVRLFGCQITETVKSLLKQLLGICNEVSPHLNLNASTVTDIDLCLAFTIFLEMTMRSIAFDPLKDVCVGYLEYITPPDIAWAATSLIPHNLVIPFTMAVIRLRRGIEHTRRGESYAILLGNLFHRLYQPSWDISDDKNQWRIRQSLRLRIVNYHLGIPVHYREGDLTRPTWDKLKTCATWVKRFDEKMEIAANLSLC